MMTENHRTSARRRAIVHRTIATAVAAGAIVMGSAIAAVAAEPDEASVSASTTTMSIVVEVPARAVVPTPDLPLPDLPISQPTGSRNSTLANTGIDGQQQVGVLVAGALSVLAGAALVAGRRRAV